MHTELLAVGDTPADSDVLRWAANLLRSGQVVAFPTETVYGLGANALDPAAVARIYEAKGRPSHNPLIVHVADISAARDLVTDWPEIAELLATALWPGPITLVLKKRPIVPAITTGGGDTVALRIPAHPVARALITACGFPLAAPSANRSNYISPTTAEHVIKSLDGRIPLVLDGGPCTGGIESTVVDLTSPTPTILRPGLFSANFLSGLAGQTFLSVPAPTETHSLPPSENATLLSPGQLSTHYAPHTPLLLIRPGDLTRTTKQYSRVGIMSITIQELCYELPAAVVIIPMPTDHESYARQLFATLHQLDVQNLDAILCEIPPDTSEWAGIRDRLHRAGNNIKNNV